uniref:Calponin-homology (CH) domain-containing protein n=1 Tax=Amphilophus citrinellus TaxID=61819 RepID=A0A3Q0RAG0_AMPCI
MSDILCRWLNQKLQLSKAVEPKSIGKDFSSGYLFGEVLHKYQLQSDFLNHTFCLSTSVSKRNNFTRLEPTLQLLGISFDVNTAQDLMQERQGVATHLLYQLYASLEKNRKAEISGTMMEVMHPAACASLHKKEHQIYSHKDLQYHIENGELCMLQLQAFHQRHKGMTFNQVTNIQVPKPPPYTSQLSLKKRQQQQKRKEWEAQVGQSFPIDFPFGGSSQGSEVTGSGTKVMLQSNSKYIQEIRKRLEENAVACKQRERRQDRFLVEQLKVHEAQEEARREEQLVKRLTRQTQQEQRLAAQLLQIRMQKEVIRENRLFREQQYQQRRERDFQEALDREAALAQQAKLDRPEEIKKELEFCKRAAAERAQRKYKKHFESCKGILEQIVDLATKAGEYRLLTGTLIPEKLMREWKELLFSDLPLYEPIKDRQPGFEFSTPLDSVELQKQEILNNQDYDEYTNMVGEWEFPEEAEEVKLPVTNNILGHIVQRLRNIVDPPISEPSFPLFSRFTLKACVLGKFCSGKTTCLSKIAEAHGICMLSTETLIEEALNAYKNGEVRYSALSKRAIQGAAVEKELRKGNAVPNELLVDIIVETISQLPAQSGWVLDGFPFDITQAHLLEKALGGAVDVENKVLNSRKNLAKDPNPPKPPPPPAPVLDLALLLDIPDECAVSRGYTQMGMIIAFQDTWPKLEKWFGEKQNILVHVDADVDSEELYSRVESILQQTDSEKAHEHKVREKIHEEYSAALNYEGMLPLPLSLTHTHTHTL